MKRRETGNWLTRTALIVGAASLIVCGEAWSFPGQSVGRWRLPSTVPQYWGFGHGPGYHAPIVRYPTYQPAPRPRLAFGSTPAMSTHGSPPWAPYCSGHCGAEHYGAIGYGGAPLAGDAFHGILPSIAGSGAVWSTSREANLGASSAAPESLPMPSPSTP